MRTMQALIFLLWACGVSHCSVSELKAEDRVAIRVVKYTGEDKHYDAFITVLKQRVRKFVETYSSRDEMSYLRDMVILKAGMPDDFERFWRSINALEVLNSSTEVKKGKLTVTSEVYLCDLKGSLPQKSVVLEQTLSTADFRLTRDTYTMVILYALAMDATRTNKPRSVIATYLKDAGEIANDIPAGARKGDVAFLIKAINVEAKALRAGGTR